MRAVSAGGEQETGGHQERRPPATTHERERQARRRVSLSVLRWARHLVAVRSRLRLPALLRLVVGLTEVVKRILRRDGRGVVEVELIQLVGVRLGRSAADEASYA